MFRFLRWKRARRLIQTGAPRQIRIHSLTAVPEGAPQPRFFRVAFEFLDPPGPQSIQFFEAAPGQEALKTTIPGARGFHYESGDGARTRVMLIGREEKLPLLPR